MMRFSCKNCGRKLKVSSKHVGKKARCPSCKSVLVVPATETLPPADNVEQANPPFDDNFTKKDLELLDVPVDLKQGAEHSDGLDKFDELKNSTIGEPSKVDKEAAPKRKFPWPVDMLLYPISKGGLVTLGMIVFLPLLMFFLIELINAAAHWFAPLYMFYQSFKVPAIFITMILCLYFYWYICECVIDSAKGGFRAPETIASTPGLEEMLKRLFQTVVCLLFFVAPMTIYYFQTKRTDTVFWILLYYAIFFYPMGLLATLVFDSFAGLNPLLLIGSVLSTFVPYCGLVILLCLMCWILFLAVTSTQTWYLSFTMFVVLLYMTVVLAHILGRFFFKYEEKLRWDV